VKTKISLIILSWNTKNLLRNCLKSVISQSKLSLSEMEIIVVDNASTDGSQEMVSKEFPEVKLIKNKQNLGYAKGNNLGVRAASADFLMILNSDTLIKPGSIEKLIDFLEASPGLSIVGPRLLNSDGTPQANCGRFPDLWVSAVMLFKEHFGGSRLVRYSPSVSGEVDWLMGAAFLARKKVFEKIGGFDEKIFMYMEEVEWFYRAKQAGFKAYFLKEAEIVHLGRGSSTTGRKEPILNIYKGLIYFFRKHKSLPELIILRVMLKLKAGMAWLVGKVRQDQYLINTYGEAFKLV